MNKDAVDLAAERAEMRQILKSEKEWDEFCARLDNSPNGKRSPITGVLKLLEGK